MCGRDWSSDVCSSDLDHGNVVQVSGSEPGIVGNEDVALEDVLHSDLANEMRDALRHRIHVSGRAGYSQIGRASCRERV